MTASEKAAVKSTQKASFGKVFAVQIAAYVVLVVLALIPGISYGNTEEPAIVSFTVVASVVMIALLAVFNPFRDGVVGHVISVVAGLLSVVCATTVMLEPGVDCLRDRVAVADRCARCVLVLVES